MEIGPPIDKILPVLTERSRIITRFRRKLFGTPLIDIDLVNVSAQRTFIGCHIKHGISLRINHRQIGHIITARGELFLQRTCQAININVAVTVFFGNISKSVR